MDLYATAEELQIAAQPNLWAAEMLELTAQLAAMSYSGDDELQIAAHPGLYRAELLHSLRAAVNVQSDFGDRITALEGPYSDERLKEIAAAEGYELTSITRDSDEVPTTAVVKWPDGTAGVFTTVTKNATWLSVDAFTVTYAGTPAKTVTQAAVTRDSAGAVTSKPALTVS